MGQGAGSRPTGHAVFTDLLDAMSWCRRAVAALRGVPPHAPTTARFYLRGCPPLPRGPTARWATDKNAPLDLLEVQAWLADHQEACAIMLEP